MTMNSVFNAGLIPTWSQADRLRKAREFAGLEQTDLAEATGMSRATISNYERGNVAPRRAGLNLWAMATGVPLKWIVNGESGSSNDDPPATSVHPPGLEPGTH